MTTNIDALLKQLRDEHKRLGEAISVLENLDGAKRPIRKGTLSAEGRRRIIAAQRARWAKAKGQKVVPITKGKMSAAGRRRIAAAQRARWAKVRAANRG